MKYEDNEIRVRIHADMLLGESQPFTHASGSTRVGSCWSKNPNDPKGLQIMMNTMLLSVGAVIDRRRQVDDENAYNAAFLASTWCRRSLREPTDRSIMFIITWRAFGSSGLYTSTYPPSCCYRRACTAGSRPSSMDPRPDFLVFKLQDLSVRHQSLVRLGLGLALS